MPRTNLDNLAAVAETLSPLLNELVFVGGSVTGLLVTDEGVGPARPTLDVDAIAGISSYGSTRPLVIAFEHWDSLKIPPGMRPYAGG